MKKILIVLTIIISCLGIRSVSAETVNITHSDITEYYCDFYVTDYDYLIELGFEDEIQELYNMLIDEYEKYSSIYPFFSIEIDLRSFSNCNQSSSFDKVEYISMTLFMYINKPVMYYYQMPFTEFYMFDSYKVSSGEYVTPEVHISAGSEESSYIFNYQDQFYNPFGFFISNFDFTLNGEVTFNISGNTNLTVKPGDVIKPMFTVDSAFQDNYIEINLNDYAYVALVPKEFYSEEKITTVYVKGQYCLTPVYNFGLQERNDVLNGTKVQRCSVKYNDFTPVRTYLLNQDMDNKSIYYVKAYDTTIDNIIKVDNTVFDITYITEENKDEPYVYIQGKYYPTIPYDKLTDTATKSEEEGYNAGASCAVGDLNCQAQYSSSFGDIFDKPLETLKGVWDSIKNVFDLIVELLSLLPVEMQSFLYLSFMLLTIIGILKLIF